MPGTVSDQYCGMERVWHVRLASIVVLVTFYFTRSEFFCYHLVHILGCKVVVNVVEFALYQGVYSYQVNTPSPLWSQQNGPALSVVQDEIGAEVLNNIVSD